MRILSSGKNTVLGTEVIYMKEIHVSTHNQTMGVPMKRIFFVATLAMMLLLAFSSVALAKGYSPSNRSSSFLDKGESYVAWDKAQATMDLASETNTASVHGNYTTTTVKCQVCHSAHKAAAAGDTLLQSTASQACVPCHLGANASSSTKVSEGNRHGSASGCTNGYCHSVAPHGVGDISSYATLSGAMLTDHGDSLLGAAILSGSTGNPEEGYIYATGSDSSLVASRIATMTVYNPGVTAAILNDTSDAAAISFGRAVGTGYICSNGGCHMNGAFNALTADATWSEWGGMLHTDLAEYGQPLGYGTWWGPVDVPAGDYAQGSIISSGGVDYDVWDLFDMRQDAVKGHTLAAVADLTTRDVAFANVGACKTCHDSIDYRISPTAKQFPHGNDVINVGGFDEGTNSAAWFTVAGSLGSGDATTTVRGTGITSGSDGACMKCHRNTGATSGVGITY